MDNTAVVTWIGILARDDVEVKLREAGMDVAPITPEQFRATISQRLSCTPNW